MYNIYKCKEYKDCKYQTCAYKYGVKGNHLTDRSKIKDNIPIYRVCPKYPRSFRFFELELLNYCLLAAERGKTDVI